MKKIFSFLVLSIGFLGLAQGSKWQDLFSYNHIIKIEQDGAELIAATKSGLFYYDRVSGEIRKLSKANGLHEVGITAFDYNPSTKVGLIGYETGALDMITPSGVNLIVDIPIARSYQGSKKVNHIFIKDNLAIISAGYGVSIFNLDKKEFEETVFFQEGNNFIASNEAFVKDNMVYASTSRGLYSHKIDLEFSIYLTWQRLNTFNLSQSDTNGQNYLVATKTAVYLGDAFQRLPYPFTNVKDVVWQTDGFLVCDADKVYQFSTEGALQNTYDFSSYQLTTGIIYNGNLFVGTAFSGILDRNLNSIKPDGPYSNIASRMTLVDDKIWVATGKKIEYFLSTYNGLGYYYYDGKKWIYPEYFLNSDRQFNILDIAVNPSNTDEIYFTNYSNHANANRRKGVYKMLNNEEVLIYGANVGSRENFPEYLAFDDQNNLFSTLGFYAGDVNFVGFYMIAPNASSEIRVKLINAKQNTSSILSYGGKLFIGAPRVTEGGLIIYDFNKTISNLNDDTVRILRGEEGLPSASVTSLAMDKYNALWIGSTTGLRVLSNATGDLSNVKLNPIVITQNGIAEELFKDAEILSIAVDSGNNKWVSVNGGGVFFLSADGQKVYNHFTKANSPLPSDEVTDIKINDKTGQVYFATSNGIVVYKGDVANVTSKFGEVVVYPNPVVYSQFKGSVKIKGLAEKTNIRITDAAGNLIHQAVSRNGYYEWNLQNQRGSRVASGIYFVLMTNEDGTDKATAKIAVVN